MTNVRYRRRVAERAPGREGGRGRVKKINEEERPERMMTMWMGWRVCLEECVGTGLRRMDALKRGRRG